MLHTLFCPEAELPTQISFTFGFTRRLGDKMAHSRAKRSSPDLRRPTMDSVPDENRERDDVSPSSIRIVLLGESGVGTGNTILGRREFETQSSRPSVTRVCSGAQATVSGRSVCVVDTPAFFDTHMSPDESAKEMARSVYLSSPGAHAFLIVFPLDVRFTEQEQKIPHQIELMFGQEMFKYSIILFTYGDQIEDPSVEELIRRNRIISHLVDQCGGRFQVFNNKKVKNRDQVNDLLQKIDSMVEQNGGGHYRNEMFKDAERFRREEEKLRRAENSKSSGFEGFYAKHQRFLVGTISGDEHTRKKKQQ